MPKRGVEVLPHALLTNHRIIARPDDPLPEVASTQALSDVPDLVYFNRPPNANRASLPPVMLLQAYGELMRIHPGYEQRYLAVLQELSKNEKPQPLIEAAVGRKMLRNGPASNAAAIDHLTRAIELGFNAPTVYEDLAEALVQAGREAEAIGPLEQGIELAPYTPVLYKSLALRYINLHHYSEARKTLERYAELFPEDDFVRGLLLKVDTTDTSGRR
jgi:tetratricopeptide (TPR) repeat protein